VNKEMWEGLKRKINLKSTDYKQNKDEPREDACEKILDIMHNMEVDDGKN
jgi:hypothetical protein